MPPWTEDELERLRVAWAEPVSIAAIARAVGRTVSACSTRARMLGLPTRRRGWGRAEEFRLMTLLEAHTPYPQIAAQLGRTEQAVRDRCALLGIAITRASGRTPSAVAKLLAVDSKCVAWWIDEGWLRVSGPHTAMGNGVLRVVEDDDLTAFLEEERYWHLWEPERITEPPLRDWATEQRRGLVFLTTGQAADRLCVTHFRVNQMIHRGTLRAVRRGRGNWLIRSDWCVHPDYSPVRPKGRFLNDDDRRVIRRWWGRVPANWIALKLGFKSEQGVLNEGRRMGLPPVGRGYWLRRVGTEVAS